MDRNNIGHNLTQQLLHDLGSAIVQGKYTQANSLPSEADICEEYGVSRSATREAVKMLAAKGLLKSRPRQGITVQPQSNWNMFDTDVLRWILSGKPSLQLLKDFMQLRLAVESEAAGLAAEYQDKAGIERIRVALERMKLAEEGLDDALEADIEFHTSILQASGNPFFMQLSSFVETALRVIIRFTNRIKGVAAASYEDHRAIYTAIANNHPKKARTTSQKLQMEALSLIQHELDADIRAKSA